MFEIPAATIVIVVMRLDAQYRLAEKYIGDQEQGFKSHGKPFTFDRSCQLMLPDPAHQAMPIGSLH
jgi:hypothetical protein